MTRQWVSHLKVTLGESAVASAAGLGSVLLELPVWAMFVGWIAFFTRGANLRHGLITLACVFAGLILGMAAAAALAVLTPHWGAASVAVGVFAVAAMVVSLRSLPVFNNLLGFFLGLVAWFAAHRPASLENLADLALAAALGTLAGWLASRVHHRWTPAA
ncbi:DUF1097 domain-containing protein [Lysobacter sp. CA199]|uniref:DUF1097 domain-containing protein n=1 Tax=Lysobacter sp. CA199 TaxID=3455608 RepID=UPI003F8D6D4D